LEVFGLLSCYSGNGAIGPRACTTVCVHFFDSAADPTVVWWRSQLGCLVFGGVMFSAISGGGGGGGGFW
jgi:hypothetical protein